MKTYPVHTKVFRRYGLPEGSIHLAAIYDEYNFVVRSISRREYQDWQLEFPDEVQFDGKVLTEAVVKHPPKFQDEPWDWDHIYAGVAAQVLEKILSVSGFGVEPDPDVYDAVQQYLDSEESMCDLIIMTAYPSYKLSELMDMDHIEWQCLFGSALKKLTMQGIDTDDILYPDRKKADGIAIPHGKKTLGFQSGGTIPNMPTSVPGGAQPFGLTGIPRDPNSQYPPGHPRNPVITNEDAPMTFYSK